MQRIYFIAEEMPLQFMKYFSCITSFIETEKRDGTRDIQFQFRKKYFSLI